MLRRVSAVLFYCLFILINEWAPLIKAISNFVATLNETAEKVIPHCSKLARTLSGKGEARALYGVLGSLILARNR